jgi:hypothetical protein
MEGALRMNTIKGLKIAAMVPLGFMVLVLLMFGIGESMGGDLSGLMHLVPVVFVGIVIWLCWKRPLWGGILLLAGAVFEAITFWKLFSEADATAIIAPLVIIILPLAFSGLLLLAAEWVGRLQRSAIK